MKLTYLLLRESIEVGSVLVINAMRTIRMTVLDWAFVEVEFPWQGRKPAVLIMVKRPPINYTDGKAEVFALYVLAVQDGIGNRLIPQTDRAWTVAIGRLSLADAQREFNRFASGEDDLVLIGSFEISEVS
jgi:hypothetical protein